MRTQRPDSATATIEDFRDKIFVVCPRCIQRAFVRDKGPEEKNATRVVLICPSCGRSKTLVDYLTATQHGRNPPAQWADVCAIGDPVDSYFRLPLWLQIPCCGEILWAYNADHLDFLEDFVRATLRENLQTERGRSNRSLRSRLPAWIKAAHNRDAVLKAIAKLKDKLQSTTKR